MSGGLVFCVSTVKDTLANLQRYVDGNLAGGADHLVVFLDAPTTRPRRRSGASSTAIPT